MLQIQNVVGSSKVFKASPEDQQFLVYEGGRRVPTGQQRIWKGAWSATEKKENYITGDDTGQQIWGATDFWASQTFTIGTTGDNENFTITSIKLKLYRELTPGDVTVSIRAASRTGADLSTGTTSGDTLTTDTGGEWREITMTALTLESDTTYSIVVRALGGDASNLIKWRLDVGQGYTGGKGAVSTNGGGYWSGQNVDYMFEIWGGKPYVIDNEVANNDQQFLCILNHTNQEPPNLTYWILSPN